MSILTAVKVKRNMVENNIEYKISNAPNIGRIILYIAFAFSKIIKIFNYNFQRCFNL